MNDLLFDKREDAHINGFHIKYTPGDNEET